MNVGASNRWRRCRRRSLPRRRSTVREGNGSTGPKTVVSNCYSAALALHHLHHRRRRRRRWTPTTRTTTPTKRTTTPTKRERTAVAPRASSAAVAEAPGRNRTTSTGPRAAPPSPERRRSRRILPDRWRPPRRAPPAPPVRRDPFRPAAGSAEPATYTNKQTRRLFNARPMSSGRRHFSRK